MNNRGQNGNPNGTPQNHHPNQGYPQQNNQYQGNGYNGQNPQNFNRNVNNKNPYQNQNSQRNNVNNPQFQGYSNGQNQPHNNMNNPQYRGQGNNGQNPQYNNMNNPQYRGQGNNAQNPQFGNNQNFNPMNRRSKMNGKMVGCITAAVAAILVVLMIFMFSSDSGKLGGGTPKEAVKNGISAIKDGDFEKLGGATPEEVAKNYISAAKDGDLKKLVNNMGYRSDKDRTEALEDFNNQSDVYKKKDAERYSDMVETGEVKSINENSAKVKFKGGGNKRNIYMYIYVEKLNGRWFVVADELIRQD